MLRSTERNENNFTVTCEILIFVKCSKYNKGLEVSPIIMKQLKMVPLSGGASEATITQQEIDHKLQLEEDNVKWLQDRMKQSSDMTSGKENVYLGFDAETLISSACDKKFKMTVSA